MGQPIIGLTTYSEPATMLFWQARFALVHEAYVEAITRAGGIAVLLPPQPALEWDAEAVVRRLDGLVLAGGADVDPALYGQEPHSTTGSPRHDRDAWELALLRAAIGADLPTLCICRGMQLLNVLRGGTLHQHVPEVTGTTLHQPVLGEFGSVDIDLDSDSAVGALLGDQVEVACHHHQAIDVVGSDLRVVGRAADGTVEAVEATDREFLLAVQWHPEQRRRDLALFAGLVASAAHRSTFSIPGGTAA
ncbi:MAG: gamma-glutamyl-gamma-aminobutyrate hydrolase family protein [Mycetocola sp.]